MPHRQSEIELTSQYPTGAHTTKAFRPAPALSVTSSSAVPAGSSFSGSSLQALIGTDTSAGAIVPAVESTILTAPPTPHRPALHGTVPVTAIAAAASPLPPTVAADAV